MPGSPTLDTQPQSGSPGIAHLRPLDGLRGVAVLAVVLFHFSDGLPGGFLGVDVFFVLSGFLITSLLVTELDGTGRIRLSSFWARRARRLLPALFLVLVTVGAYTMLAADQVHAQHTADDALAAFGYVANWHFIASSQSYIDTFIHTAPSPVLHTWSLAIEEQFYLLWPLIVAGVGAVAAAYAARRSKSVRRFRHALLVVCCVLAVASLVRMVTLFDPNGNPNRAYYGTDSRAFALLIGAALGVVTAGAPAISRRTARRLVIAAGVAAAAALVAAMAMVEVSSAWLYQGGYGAVALVMALVLVAAAQPGRNPLRRGLESRALVGLGLISYGVYLWHWPAAVWLTEEATGLDGVALFALRAIATLTVATASYFLVEMPIRRGRFPVRKPALRRSLQGAIVGAVAATLLVPALTLPSVLAAPKSKPSRVVASVTASYASAPHCDDRKPDTRRPPAARKLRVMLVGNSVGDEIAPCLGQIVEKKWGAHFDDLTRNGYPVCELYPEIEAHLRNPATRPDVAILFAYPQSCKLFSWERELAYTIDLWRKAGVRVYLVPHVPRVVPVHEALGSEDPFPDVAAAYNAAADGTFGTVSVLDAGVFLRDDLGVYQWRMPCLPQGEPGCAPDHTIGIRTWVDSGLHFCASAEFNGNFPCPKADAGGARRVAAAIAGQLMESLVANPLQPAVQKPGSEKASGS